MAFSPGKDGDSKHLVAVEAGQVQNKLAIWTIDGKKKKTLLGHSGQVSSVCCSRDGETIVSGSIEEACPSSTTDAPRLGTIRVWDVETGQEVLEFQGPAEHVAFSEDGEDLIAWDNTGKKKVWSARDRSETIAPPHVQHIAIETPSR
jgi:WD40 repeat protein